MVVAVKAPRCRNAARPAGLVEARANQPLVAIVNDALTESERRAHIVAAPGDAITGRAQVAVEASRGWDRSSK